MPTDPPIRPIDYTSIRYPSDRITLADLRRVNPDRFDVDDARQFEGVQDADPEFHIPPMLTAERLLAKAAYAAAAGDPTDVLGQAWLTRKDCVDDLANFYAAYGVASGHHQTEELVRDIEAQAVAQVASRQR